MTKEEYLDKLKVFQDFKFFEEDHHYEYKGKRVGISVTRLIEQYCNEFNAEEVAEKVAEKNFKIINNLYRISGKVSEQEYEMYPTSVEDILAQWKYKADFACAKGTTCHEFAQSLWSKQKCNLLSFDNSDNYWFAVSTIQKQAIHFWQDYREHLEHLQDELVVGSAEYDIASAIDHLFINKLTGGLVLVDYKTNSDIHKSEKYAKNMKVPLQHMKDYTLNHYYIQLSIYRYLLEKYTGLEVSEMFIVYFSENIKDYEIIEIPYLKEEVIKILELRRANKMAKMLLVMGEPASGKTVSLRNIPKEELYYIDCDKKGLNYKGWKNDFNQEKKNYYRSNDGESIAKCMLAVSEKREDIKYIAIDTINSIMIADEMKRSKDKNFDKWVDLASCIFNLINIVPDLRDDLTVIFIGHTQTDDEGFTRLLTNGKKLNKIGLEKYFDTVLIAKNMDGKYVFETTSPNSTARVPMGCYENEQHIENDLYEIIKELKEY